MSRLSLGQNRSRILNSKAKYDYLLQLTTPLPRIAANRHTAACVGYDRGILSDQPGAVSFPVARTHAGRSVLRRLQGAPACRAECY